MLRKSWVVGVALLMASAAAAQTSTAITCESVNNIRHTCRADVTGGVLITRVLSENPCIRGRSWDVRRDGKGIWVDKGCRAEFIIGSGMNTARSAYGRTVICESDRSGRMNCPADTSMGVVLIRQISSRSCRLGRDWGYDQNGIWTRHGCRAEFGLGVAAAAAPMASSSRPLVVCESVNNAINHCKADTTMGVSLARQMSDNACIRGETWGFDSNGIWVKNGCRAEFLLDVRP